MQTDDRYDVGEPVPETRRDYLVRNLALHGLTFLFLFLVVWYVLGVDRTTLTYLAAIDVLLLTAMYLEYSRRWDRAQAARVAVPADDNSQGA